MNELPKDVLEMVDALDKMQIAYARSTDRGEMKTLRSDFRELSRKVIAAGYVLKYRKVRGRNERHWIAISKEDVVAQSRNTECAYEYTNVRPDRKTLRGDCTTRAMAFLLSDTKTYDDLENEQYAVGERMRCRRNSRKAWTKVLSGYGYRKISLRRKVKRSVLGMILGGYLQKPVATVSSKHVAVLDVGGIVRDIWDSRGGRVSEIYAPLSQAYGIEDFLNNNGIPCEIDF